MALEESAIAVDLLPDSLTSSATSSAASPDLDRPLPDHTASSSPTVRSAFLSFQEFFLSRLNASTSFVPKLIFLAVDFSFTFTDLNQVGKTLVHVYATPAVATFHPVQDHLSMLLVASSISIAVYGGIAQEVVVGSAAPAVVAVDLDHASKHGEVNASEAAQRLLIRSYHLEHLLKIFSSWKSSNGGASSGSRTAKSDSILCIATVEELNDEDNWRNALKVRLLPRSTVSLEQENLVKLEGKMLVMKVNTQLQGDDSFALESTKLNEESHHHIDAKSNELPEEHGNDRQRRGRGRGRVKGQGQGQGRGRPQFHQNNRGGHFRGSMSNTLNRGSNVGNALHISILLVQGSLFMRAVSSSQAEIFCTSYAGWH
ncbi:hypothetical protein HAX54_024149 [Datura stramonium]|uniref:Uncharacterized protein n=1 Tax=Datura stramonium TaxID=4076 RepID=A0ABS8S5C8_DATST|nr:hypothetical protein [Datura stramonium]